MAWMDGRDAKMSHFSFSGIHHVGMEILVLPMSPLTFPGCCGSSGRQKGQRGQEELSLVRSWPQCHGQAGQGTGRGVGRGLSDASPGVTEPGWVCLQQKLTCKWKDPSPWSGLSEGNTNPAAATGDEGLIRAATPTTRLYTFLINHLKFLTVRRIESGASLAERPRGCASSPGSPDGWHRGSGPSMWHCLEPLGIAWCPGHCSVTMWKAQGSFTFLLSLQPVPSAVLGPLTARQSWEQHRERGNLLKQANCNDSPFPNVSRFGGERSK